MIHQSAEDSVHEANDLADIHDRYRRLLALDDQDEEPDAVST
jgi:hypothetical protein